MTTNERTESDKHPQISAAPMAAAPMLFKSDGSVDWGNMWDGFCALAQEGGPPHRDSLLSAPAEQDRQSDPYRRVAQEIIRGIAEVSGLRAYAVTAGWIAIRCDSSAMARWISAAIRAENVESRCDALLAFVPCGEQFQLGNEIKNVITAVAKTSHYWKEHLQSDLGADSLSVPRAGTHFGHRHAGGGDSHQHGYLNEVAPVSTTRELASIRGGATDIDDFRLMSAPFKAFVAAVNEVLERESDPVRAIAQIRDPFSRLLTDDSWLDAEFAQPALKSGMGGGIGSYLLYRNGTRDLSISSLVVPAGAKTPVHNHLAWGLVGLYRGEQFEEVFHRADDGTVEGHADLAIVDRRHLKRGDFYELIPPAGDIHGVVAANEQPSVSIHLLRNDVGCIDRQSFVPEENLAKPFRSGYVNARCDDDPEEDSATPAVDSNCTTTEATTAQS